MKLSDLAGPDAAGWSDVAVFVRADGSESEPFVIEEYHGKNMVRTGTQCTSFDEEGGSLPIRRLGRGRLEPARIVMEGEADLAGQVRTLRAALETAMGLVTVDGPAGHHLYAALAATEPKEAAK